MHQLIFGVKPTPSPEDLNRQMAQFLGLQPQFLMRPGPDLPRSIKRLAATLPEPTPNFVATLNKKLESQSRESLLRIQANGQPGADEDRSSPSRQRDTVVSESSGWLDEVLLPFTRA